MATYLIGDVHCRYDELDQPYYSKWNLRQIQTPMADWRFGRPRSRSLDVLRYVKSLGTCVWCWGITISHLLAVFAGY